MPCFSVKVPVTISVTIIVDAPDKESAPSVDVSKLKRSPIYNTAKGIEANHKAFSIGWIGSDGYRWSEAEADPCDPIDAAIIIDHDGTIYPTREARDAAIGADEDED